MRLGGRKRQQRRRRLQHEEEEKYSDLMIWRRLLMWDCESSLYDSFELRAFSTHFASRLADELGCYDTSTSNCKPLRFFLANSPQHNPPYAPPPSTKTPLFTFSSFLPNSSSSCFLPQVQQEEKDSVLLCSGSKKRKHPASSTSSILAIFHRLSSKLANACCFLLPSDLNHGNRRRHSKDAPLRHLLHNHHTHLLLQRSRRRQSSQVNEYFDEQGAAAAKLLTQIGEQQANASIGSSALTWRSCGTRSIRSRIA